jgi:chromate transporter
MILDPEQLGRVGEASKGPTFRDALSFWFKLGCTSFGGPAGQIAVMHQELVEKKKWISEERFFHALNYCMLLPGPEAQQLATYIGWLLHRTWGGLAAGVLFVLPGGFLLWGLSWLYVVAGTQPWMSAIFYGLKPAVLAIVGAALVRMGSKSLKSRLMWMVAIGAFCAIFFLRLPFPLIVLGAGIIGFAGGAQDLQNGKTPAVAQNEMGGDAAARDRLPSVFSLLRTLGVGLTLWWAPVFFARMFEGGKGVLYQMGVFFSKAAMVTFGGAYAILPYVSQQAVEQFGWLAAPQMLDGLAFAETTPGPLIIVLEFVGFLGAWHQPGRLTPLHAATLGALMTVWCTFAPSFVWIFVGAPFVERLRGNQRIANTLSAVTAAVVGVILNLACWFGKDVLFPKITGPDWAAMGITGVALFALVRLQSPTWVVVFGGGLLGALYKLFV